MIQLFHYVHCPFCVRIRMALGFLQVPYESIVLSYDDEETPVQLTGKKMLPIMRDGDRVMNESLDIIAFVDAKNLLNRERYYQRSKEYEELLTAIGTPLHSLAMPYWIWTPEFTEGSRNYFRNKKEKKRGPFENLVAQSEYFEQQLLSVLEKHKSQLKPFFDSDRFSLVDIVIAAHLWGAYVVPEWQFPREWHEYLQRVKKLCVFDYHHDFWTRQSNLDLGVTT